MLEILNRILAERLDPGAVMTKLDEIQKGVNEIRTLPPIEQSATQTLRISQQCSFRSRIKKRS